MIAVRSQGLPKPIKWFSIPRLFRYERPQRGRFREFWQLNLDIVGVEGVEADAEIMAAGVEVLRACGLSEEDFVVRYSDRRLIEAVMDGLGLDAAAQRVEPGELRAVRAEPRRGIEIVTGGDDGARGRVDHRREPAAQALGDDQVEHLERVAAGALVALAAAGTGEFFGPTAGESFGVEIGSSVMPGSDISLTLTVQGASVGPFRMIVKAGDPVEGSFATHDVGRTRLSVTNFGGLGYYTGIHGSDFVLRGEGFRFPPTSPNWL